MTRNVLMIVAKAKDNAIVHRCPALEITQSPSIGQPQVSSSLAKPLVIIISLAFTKQNLHIFGHIESQKHVGITKQRSACGQKGRFGDGIFTEILFPKCLSSQVPFHNKGPVKTSKDTD